MSRLAELPPDQRAVLQLLLQKDRSYAEIAQLLRVDADTVRSRAHAAVASLVADGPSLSSAEQAQCADLLLGEQTASERSEARALLADSEPALVWTYTAAAELEPIAGGRLPDLPPPPPGLTPSSPPLPIPSPLPVVAPPATRVQPGDPGSVSDAQYPPADTHYPPAQYPPVEAQYPPVEAQYPPVGAERPPVDATEPDRALREQFEEILPPPPPPPEGPGRGAVDFESFPSSPTASPAASSGSPAHAGASGDPGVDSARPSVSGPTSPSSTAAPKTGFLGKLSWPVMALAISVGLFLLVVGVFRLLEGEDPEPTADAPSLTQTQPNVNPPPSTSASTVVSPTATAPPSSTASPTTTAPGSSPVSAQIVMAPPSGAATGVSATVSLIPQDGGQAIALAAKGLPASTATGFYALWFANARADAVFLGYTPTVTKQGTLRVFAPLASSADTAQFNQIWLTRQVVTAASRKTTPSRPGKVVLSGDLPR